MEKLQLVFYGTDSALLEKLRSCTTNMQYVSCADGIGPAVTTKVQLDAIWVGLMAATELFGLIPPFPLHQAIVLRAPQAQLDCGFPTYGIAGVALFPTDPSTPDFKLRLTVSALLKAIQEFNSGNEEHISRVGVLPGDFQMPKMSVEAAVEIIREVWDVSVEQPLAP